MRVLISADETLHTTETVWMEVLAGGRDAAHTTRLRRLLSRCEMIPIDGLSDHEDAASLYRTCRRAGETIRAINDCLIATVAIRADVDVLQCDRDFEAVARHSTLRLVT